MSAAVSTTTESGEVRIPQAMRDILKVSPGDQMESLSDGESVLVLAAPTDPLALGTREEFWESIERAREDHAEGRVCELRAVTCGLRARYGL